MTYDPQAGIRSLFFALTSFEDWSHGRAYDLMSYHGLHVSNVFLLQQSNGIGGWSVRAASDNLPDLFSTYQILSQIPQGPKPVVQKTYDLSEAGQSRLAEDLAAFKATPKWRILYTGQPGEMPMLVTNEQMQVTPRPDWKLTNWKA